MLLVLPLRVRRKITTKERLVRKPRTCNLNGKEICVRWKVFPLEQMKEFQHQRKMHDGEFMMKVSTKRRVSILTVGAIQKSILEIDLFWKIVIKYHRWIEI